MTRIQAIIRSGACALLLVCGFTFPVWAQGVLAANDGSVLPFPLVPFARSSVLMLRQGETADITEIAQSFGFSEFPNSAHCSAFVKNQSRFRRPSRAQLLRHACIGRAPPTTKCPPRDIRASSCPKSRAQASPLRVGPHQGPRKCRKTAQNSTGKENIYGSISMT
jgi:hypothetical protein